MPFKLVLTGVTGRIGGEVLTQALRNPYITSIIALARRVLPDAHKSPKLELIVVNDFKSYPDDVIAKLSGADGCVWCMSTPAGDPVLELEYPKAFAAAFAPTLVSHGKRFRYLHLTGALAEQDQNKALWIVPAMRRVKGQGELQMIEVANRNELWETIIARPGGVAKGGTLMANVGGMLGGSSGWSIRADELALALLDAVVNGSEVQIMARDQLLKRGQELLKESHRAQQ